MKKILVLSHEVFSCYWLGIKQPINGIKKDDCKKYIDICLSIGNCKIEQFEIKSNFGIYTYSQL